MTKHSNDPSTPTVYEVGYAKPPQKHQFKPGSSGNPKGRPKGAKGIATIYKEAFDRKVTVKVDGKTKTMSAKEIAMHQQAKKAMAGDQKSTELMLQLDAQYSPPDTTVTPEDAAIDLKIIDNLLTLHAKLGGASSDDHQGSC